MFAQIYSPDFPPPGSVGKTSHRSKTAPSSRCRLKIPGYSQRLTVLYSNTILTQPQIIAKLKREFKYCFVSKSGLKRDLKALGLRRYNPGNCVTRGQDSTGVSNAHRLTDSATTLKAANCQRPTEIESEPGNLSIPASSPFTGDTASLGSLASCLSAPSLGTMEIDENSLSLLDDLFPSALEFSNFLSEEFSWDSDKSLGQS